MTTPAAADYRDRTTGLVIFGILEILVGALCALLLLILLVTGTLRPASSHPPSLSVAPALFVYGFGSVTFIWLGIGSIAARRWARALLLCLSAVGLCAGLMASAVLALMLPRVSGLIRQTAVQDGRAWPPELGRIVVAVAAIGVLVIYILIPLALFLFYRSPQVKRTCEVRDPVERWTDRCPLPVLALSLLCALGIAYLPILQTGVRAIPLFGIVFSGAAYYGVIALVAGLLLYLAWGLYRLRVHAWWIALAAQLFGGASGVITAVRYDLPELYLKVGMDQRVAYATTHLLSPAFRWYAPAAVLPGLVWLLCIRRYFEPPAPPAVPLSLMALPSGPSPRCAYGRRNGSIPGSKESYRVVRSISPPSPPMQLSLEPNPKA